MKRFATIIALFALVCTITTGAYAGPDNPEKDKAKQAEAAKWEAFSENIVHALQSDNEGAKLGALQMVIRYGADLNVDEAIFDVMRLYRDNDDDDVRRMAVVAMGQMKNAWAIGFLRLSKDFEQSPTVRKTIQAVVAQYETAQGGVTARMGV